jgi:outer membrane lipoprotein carrier protein
MRRLCLLGLAGCLLTAAAAPPFDVTRLLKTIENRYNGAATMRMNFSESYTFQNRPRPAEWGVLSLKKPGKMRWVYQKPAGKLFVSDGKDVYYYSSQANRVEKLRLKEADDMRAPLAFLLGKLDFSRDFGKYTWREEGDAVWISCDPKNPSRSPFAEISFKAVKADGRILRLRVVGQDHSILEFEFESETLNPPLTDGFFLFQIPPGAEYVDLSANPAKN